MKSKLLILLGIAGLLTSGISCRQHDYREITIEVPEMRNSACVRVISGALSRAPGLKREAVKFDIPSRKITVVYDSLLAADKNIEFMVVKAGFSANGIPADSNAAAALPPECRR